MGSALDNSVDRTLAWKKRKAREGAVQVNITLYPDKDPEALTGWRRLVADHGGPKAALAFAIKSAFGVSKLTDEELMSMLGARLAERAMLLAIEKDRAAAAPPAADPPPPADPQPVRPEPKTAPKRPKKSA